MPVSELRSTSAMVCLLHQNLYSKWSDPIQSWKSVYFIVARIRSIMRLIEPFPKIITSPKRDQKPCEALYNLVPNRSSTPQMNHVCTLYRSCFNVRSDTYLWDSSSSHVTSNVTWINNVVVIPLPPIVICSSSINQTEEPACAINNPHPRKYSPTSKPRGARVSPATNMQSKPSLTSKPRRARTSPIITIRPKRSLTSKPRKGARTPPPHLCDAD